MGILYKVKAYNWCGHFNVQCMDSIGNCRLLNFFANVAPNVHLYCHHVYICHFITANTECGLRIYIVTMYTSVILSQLAQNVYVLTIYVCHQLLHIINCLLYKYQMWVVDTWSIEVMLFMLCVKCRQKGSSQRIKLCLSRGWGMYTYQTPSVMQWEGNIHRTLCLR